QLRDDRRRAARARRLTGGEPRPRGGSPVAGRRTFFYGLPRRRPIDEAGHGGAPRLPGHPKGTIVPGPSRVPLAHLDAAERERLTRFLREGGAEVFVASDGDRARSLAAQHAPTLALLSCMLPGVSGFEVCRGLGETAAGRAPVPVVLLSDADDPYVRARARHVGAKRVLSGSVSSAQVKDLLAEEFGDADPL